MGQARLRPPVLPAQANQPAYGAGRRHGKKQRCLAEPPCFGAGQCVRGMVGVGTGRCLALDIRLNRDNTERGFTASRRFSFSFQGAARKAGWPGCSVCACVCARALCVCVCLACHRDTKSTACRRGRERSSSRSHEVFWIKRLKPAHFSSLSVRRRNGEGEKRGNEIPWEWGAGWVF